MRPPMTNLTTNSPTEELQRLDAAHHMHPFTCGSELTEKAPV
jgi:putrescine aminotransferase